MMAEHPILFNSDMVRAILEGRKTQTRRIIKPQPWVRRTAIKLTLAYHICDDPILADVWYLSDQNGDTSPLGKCPYGKPGDVLVVKEGYRIRSCVSRGKNSVVRGYYTADDRRFKIQLTDAEYSRWNARKKPFDRTPGRFMYKSLARLKPVVKSVRVERVQDISEADCIAEGIEESTVHGLPAFYLYDGRAHWTADPRESFQTIWDFINAKRGYGWDKNPWVWVIEFERLT